MSRRLLLAALVTALGTTLALGGLTVAPAQAATWPAPVVVAGPEPSFSYRYDPQTVVTPDGTTVATWADTGAGQVAARAGAAVRPPRVRAAPSAATSRRRVITAP